MVVVDVEIVLFLFCLWVFRFVVCVGSEFWFSIDTCLFLMGVLEYVLVFWVGIDCLRYCLVGGVVIVVVIGMVSCDVLMLEGSCCCGRVE